jgi:cell division protein FtsB
MDNIAKLKNDGKSQGELYEALARQQGLARSGEIIYTFRDPVVPND